jgi:hypothetical protein
MHSGSLGDFRREVARFEAAEIGFVGAAEALVTVD